MLKQVGDIHCKPDGHWTSHVYSLLMRELINKAKLWLFRECWLA